MNTKLILRKLISPFVEPYADITKNSVLSKDDVDGNFIYLKGNTLYSAETVFNTVTLKRLNGNDLSFNLIPQSGGTINNVENIGGGVGIFNSLTSGNTVIQLNSITGSSSDRISVNVSLTGNTINLDVNEQNLTLWPLVVNGNQLLSGGASFLSGLTFNVTYLTYIIDGIIYSANPSTVVVSSGNSTFDRIDVIIADISGNTSVVQGIPSSDPVKPDIDESTQIEVTFITIPTGASTYVSPTTLVYNEKVGPPNEWTFTTPNSPFISGNSTNIVAYSGSVSIALSAATNAKSFTLSSSTIFDSTTQNTIQFAIKNKTSWPGSVGSTRLRFTILSSTGVAIGTTVDLYNGRFGFSSTNISSWQLITIPLSNFSLTTSLFSQIKVTTVNTGILAINTNIDAIKMIVGIPTSTPNPKWLNIKVDNGTSIPALVSNDTLTLSGGTNIGTRINGVGTIVFDLDNNIKLTGISATTISATTYLNLPSISGGGFSGFTGGTAINSIKANNPSNLHAIGIDSFAIGSATTATTFASVAMGSGSIANGGNTPLFVDSGITVTSAVTITTTDPNYSGTQGYTIKFSNVDVSNEWLSYLNTYSSRFTLSGSSGFLPSGTTIPVVDVYYDGTDTYIVNNLTPSATTVVSGMTMVASDPFTSFPAIKFSGIDVSATWNAYLSTFGSTFTLYGGTGSTTTFGPANSPFVYFDGTDTYLADESNVITDLTFTQISGNSFNYVTYLNATGYSIISGATFVSVVTGYTEYPAFSFGLNTQALGQYSHAEGELTTASGNISHAEGFLSTAVGLSSHAEGYTTIAFGDYSHTEGSGTEATGNGAHAEGVGAQANSYGSHCEGISTLASNIGAHCEGGGSTASGQYSHAEGNFTTAIGQYSHSEGNTNIASGNQSHAEGINTTASGVTSHAEGGTTHAFGELSHAEGAGTLASGFVSHAEGASSTASGQYTHAEGAGTTAIGINGAHSEGQTTIASGQTSHAEGYQTQANGLTSHSEGYQTTAQGQSSHSEGQGNKALGDYSHSEGFSTRTIGISSHAEGDSSTASGVTSHAEGYQTHANGLYSHTEGYQTTASGQTSHAEGAGTTANGFASHASGLNTIATGNQSATIGGNGNTISGTNSVIIGGQSIIGNLNNTTYVPDLVITKSASVPTTTGSAVGTLGSVTWDNTYLYVKTNIGWGRIALDYSF